MNRTKLLGLAKNLRSYVVLAGANNEEIRILDVIVASCRSTGGTSPLTLTGT